MKNVIIAYLILGLSSAIVHAAVPAVTQIKVKGKADSQRINQANFTQLQQFIEQLPTPRFGYQYIPEEARTIINASNSQTLDNLIYSGQDIKIKMNWVGYISARDNKLYAFPTTKKHKNGDLFYTFQKIIGDPFIVPFDDIKASETAPDQKQYCSLKKEVIFCADNQCCTIL